MEEFIKEEKEIFTIDDKVFTVTTRISKNCLIKDNIVKLIARYAMQELDQDDF